MTTEIGTMDHGDLTDPTWVATQCLIFSKGILAVMHPEKKDLSLLGFNPVDGVLHGLREQSDSGMIVMQLDSAANKLVPMMVEGAAGEPPKQINFTAEQMRLCNLKGLIQGLCKYLKVLDAIPNLSQACKDLGAGGTDVIIGNLVSPSAHVAAVSFATKVMLAVKVAVEGGPYLATGKPALSDFDAKEIEETHLARITELLSEFPTHNSPELARVSALIEEEAQRANRNVQPDGLTVPEDQESAEDLAAARHSLDSRSVVWFGTQYSFTAIQAACVKLLWEGWKRGTPEIGGETLLEAAGSNADRLPLVFRDHAAWGKMIVPGTTKGTYRLNEPAGE